MKSLHSSILSDYLLFVICCIFFLLLGLSRRIILIRAADSTTKKSKRHESHLLASQPIQLSGTTCITLLCRFVQYNCSYAGPPHGLTRINIIKIISLLKCLFNFLVIIFLKNQNVKDAKVSDVGDNSCAQSRLHRRRFRAWVPK